MRWGRASKSPRCSTCAASLTERSRAAAEALARRGVTLQFGVEPIEASAHAGSQVSRLEYTYAAGADGRAPGRARARGRLALDGLWMSVGFAPANALLQQARAQFSWSDALGQFVPHELPAGLYACGKVNGVFGYAERLADGADAGACAAAGLSPGCAAACAGAARR